jgi:hypothetical protein
MPLLFLCGFFKKNRHTKTTQCQVFLTFREPMVLSKNNSPLRAAPYYIIQFSSLVMVIAAYDVPL